MMFMCMMNFVFLLLSCFIDQEISQMYQTQKELFGAHLFGKEALLESADPDLGTQYCDFERGNSLGLFGRVQLFSNLGVFCAISYIASICSLILTVSSKQNVDIDLGLMAF